MIASFPRCSPHRSRRATPSSAPAYRRATGAAAIGPARTSLWRRLMWSSLRATTRRSTTCARALAVVWSVTAHRVSFAVVAREVLADDRSRRHAAQRLAEDVAIWDQRGCLSPQVCIVEGDVDAARDFGATAAAALAELAERLPRGAADQRRTARGAPLSRRGGVARVRRRACRGVRARRGRRRHGRRRAHTALSPDAARSFAARAGGRRACRAWRSSRRCGRGSKCAGLAGAAGAQVGIGSPPRGIGCPSGMRGGRDATTAADVAARRPAAVADWLTE